MKEKLLVKNKDKFLRILKSKMVFLLSLGIILISIVIILLAFYIFDTGVLNSILITLGTTGLSAGIVSLAIEVFLTDIFSESIKEKFKSEIGTLTNDIKTITTHTSSLSPKIDGLVQSLDKFSSDEAVLKGAHEAQVKSLTLNRMASKDNIKSIMDCMDSSKEIKILGTTLRQFFTKDRDLIEKLLLSAKSGKKIDILIANPFGKCVVKRTLLEQGEKFENKCKENPLNYRLSETYTDIRDILTVFEREYTDFDNVKLKCYNDYPSMWLIVTDTCAFFQPYQYGRIEQTFCIGESFVIFRFGKGLAYDLLSQHFNYIWNDKSNLSHSQMLQKYKNDDDLIKELLSDENVFWR